jgi:hypothetical protein
MGADSPTGFEQLVRQVHDRATGGDAAALLRAGVAVSAEHAATADGLLDHFVARARGAGMSWTDIGAQLGVSRQAARQRFADRAAMGVLPFAARTATRLQACLDSAGQHARAEGAGEIGTQHLLVGLMAEGVAAAILESLQVSVEAIGSSSQRLFGPSLGPTAEIPPMSAEARCALDAAAFKAAATDSASSAPEVRTEHLLAVLALDPGSRARRVLNDLHVDIAAIKRELQCYLTLSPSRPARWWKRRAATQDGCSFCGRVLPGAAQLVHGPGVAICSACVALAGEILEDRQPIP